MSMECGVTAADEDGAYNVDDEVDDDDDDDDDFVCGVNEDMLYMSRPREWLSRCTHRLSVIEVTMSESGSSRCTQK